jgi:uncharacterized membrane protein YbhN (UPF0104 family)
VNRRIDRRVSADMDAEQRGGARRWWGVLLRLLITGALLVVLALRFGGAAFTRGIGALTVPLVLAAVALTAVSTVCAAWRWWAVARQLDVPLPAAQALYAYYRSQFLNSVLPGGVVGDAHRAVAHGREVDDVGRAARAVAWERTAGQGVQLALSIAVLLIMPSPGRSLLPMLAAVAACALAAAWLIRRGRRHGTSWPARIAAVVRADLHVIAGRRVWPVWLVASCGVVASHVALYVLVARTVDPAASVRVLVPLAVIVQLGTGIPLSVGGWGLREGVAGWAFGAAGLGAAAGVSVSAAYGVASLIAVLPGAAVLAAEAARRSPRGRADRSAPLAHGAVSHG